MSEPKDDFGYEAPSSPTDPPSLFSEEVREQWKTASPSLMSFVFYKIPWLISLRFAGVLGAKKLAAAALATTLCNVTGLSFAVGLTSAMTTLAGQARGDLRARADHLRKRRVSFQGDGEPPAPAAGEQEPLLEKGDGANYNTTDGNKRSGKEVKDLLPLVYLYRGILIQLVFMVPIGIWWLVGIKPLLLRLGQDPELAEMTEEYLRVLTPGLWSYSINWTLTSWLQAIEMADVPAYAAALGLILHIPANYFFIYALGWDYIGVGVATVVFQIVQPFCIVVYVFGSSAGERRVLESLEAQVIERTKLSFWKEAKKAATSLGGIGQYLSLAIPGIIVISEWWASEITIFLSGRLVPDPAAALGGMTIYQAINTFCFMFPVSWSIAGATRVGNLLGAGNSSGARWAGAVCVVCAGSLSLAFGLMLFFIPHNFLPSLFAPGEEAVVQQTSSTITLLSTYVFADGLQAAFNGIIKGCGRQCVTMPIVLFAYWVVGVPIAYYVAFVRHDGSMCTDAYFCGVVGLVAGLTTGTWTHMLILGIVVVATTDWAAEAHKATQRLAFDLHPESDMETLRRQSLKM